MNRGNRLNEPMFLSLSYAPPKIVHAPPQNFLPLFDRNGQRVRTGRTLNLNHGLQTSRRSGKIMP